MMNQKFQFLLFLVFGILMLSLQTIPQKHVGTWAGLNQEGGETKMTLDSSGNAIFEEDGDKLECRYKIDYSKNPIWLDIIVLKKNTNVELMRKKFIIRFLSEFKMELRVNTNGDARFDKFDSSDKETNLFFYKID
jgi:hypothetical protein